MLLHLVSLANDSALHPSFFNSDYALDIKCFISGPSSFMVTAYFITYILLLLPLCIVILRHGFQQCQKQSTTSSGATMSHSDCFTYHMVTIELTCVFAYFISCIAIHVEMFTLFLVGFHLFGFTWWGEVGFHVLTCVERYLAVVHPITYLNLRNKRGIRMRNLGVGGVWLLGFVWTSLLMQNFYNIVNFCFLLLSMTTVFFCSLSVLCVLVHPGPGDQEGGIKKVSQSKLRAFYTIISIMTVLIVRFSWCLAWAITYLSKVHFDCVVMTADLWFNLPCALTLPLLFLHRRGKLVCSKQSDQSG